MPPRQGGRYEVAKGKPPKRTEGTAPPPDGRFGPRDAGGAPLDESPGRSPGQAPDRSPEPSPAPPAQPDEEKEA